MTIRCFGVDPGLMRTYHDEQWGVPVTDERLLFELLLLEGAQAGLSWEIVLKRREGYRLAFDDFDMEKIARYDDEKMAALKNDPGIIRNRLKIASAVGNARAAIALRETDGGLVNFLWSFVEGKPLMPRRKLADQWPAESDISKKMSKELKKRGFNFVGSVICYALMQSAGLVNDHPVECFRHDEVVKLGGKPVG